MSRYVLEGWIKAKLEYPENIRYGDPDKYFFAEHGKFNPTYVDKNKRIKYFQHIDGQTGLVFQVIFGYEEFGAKFTASIEDTEEADRVTAFSSLLAKVVSGYINLRNFFLSNISPKEMKIGFSEGTTHLLIAMYGFFRGLDEKQQGILINKTKKLTKKYAAKVYTICKNEKPKKTFDEVEVKIKTMTDLTKEEKFLFIDATLAWGDYYLFMDHFLMRGPFSSIDPSLSLNTIAYAGLMCSLVLQDTHYELEDLGSRIGSLRNKIDKMINQRFPSSVDTFKEELARIEKMFSIISSELKNYTSLSNKIFESLSEDREAKRLFPILRTIGSLPDSSFIADNILDLNRLEYFSNFDIDIVNLRSDVSILESRFDRTEVASTVIVLVLLLAIVGSLAYNKIGIGEIADFVGILTFGIALVLLILRIAPGSRPSLHLRQIWQKLKRATPG